MTKKKKIVREVEPTTPREKFMDLRDELRRAVTERDAEIDGLLIGLLAREHILLLGPPGTAKTLLISLVTQAISGCVTFKRLLTRFSVPEELFGPYSLQGLKNDTYRRVLKNKLPEAHLAFLDEVFKANSSILNALLTLINERTFENGDTAVECPLETLVGASNELPESAELDALYDRFMLRFWTSYISDHESFKGMIMAGDAEIKTSLTIDELHTAQAEVDRVTVTEDTVDLLVTIKAAVEKEGFVASDRRWVKTLRILQANAWLSGRDTVEAEDAMVLCHVLWKEPKDRGALMRVISKVANPLANASVEVTDAMVEIFKSLPIHEDIPESQQAAVFTKIIEANATFKTAIEKLERMANGKSSACVIEAVQKIEEMKRRAANYAAKISGLS